MRLRAAVILIIAVAGSIALAGPAAGGHPQAASTERYRVAPGDTLWSLARRFGTTPDRLAALNGISTEAILKIGRELRVPGRFAVTPAGARLAKLPSRGAQWASDLMAFSTRYLGTRYLWAGTTPAGFDCSGFLSYIFARSGVTLPRTTFDMYDAGVPVPRDGLQIGDIVFFETVSPGPSHAGIYLGDGRFIHSSSGFGRVTITPLDHPYYAPRYLGARRF